MQGNRPQTGRAPFQGLLTQQSFFLAKPLLGAAPLRLGMRRNALKAMEAACGGPSVPAKKALRKMDRINGFGP